MFHPFLRNLTAIERIYQDLRGLGGRGAKPTSLPVGLSTNDDLPEIIASSTVGVLVLIAIAIIIVWKFFTQIKEFVQRVANRLGWMNGGDAPNHPTDLEPDLASGPSAGRPRNLTDEEVIRMREAAPRAVRAVEVRTYV